MLGKHPGFTAAATVTLALGIGVNTAVFSVVNAVLLRPLHFRDPDRLALIYEENRGLNLLRQVASGPNFLDWKNQSTVFEQMAAYVSSQANLTGGYEPERITFTTVTADFFAALQVEPKLGRTFLPEDFKADGPNVVVLSYGFWQRHFGAASNVIGQTLTLDGRSYSIIGVAPPEAQWPQRAQLWMPRQRPFDQTNRRSQSFNVIGRLKVGATWRQAQIEMESIGRRLAHEYPVTNSGWSVAVVPLNEIVTGSVKDSLLILVGVVGFVLLIACANVANLLLARAASRQKEMAIRAALGASRLRVIRQLLTESALLSLVGGALGLLLAFWTNKTLVGLSVVLPRVNEVGIDRRVLGFTLIVSLLSSLTFGLAPAVQTSKLDLNEVLKESGRKSGSRSRRGLRSLLVITEIALSLVLLVGAGLMLKSFRSLSQVNPGFNPEHVWTMQLSMPPNKYAGPPQLTTFSQAVFQRLAALSGVKAVAAVANPPLRSIGWGNSFVIEGRAPLPAGQLIVADNNRVTADYFRAMEIPMVRGRSFSEHDTAQTPAVVVISETMAQRFWPGADPLGEHLTIHDGGPNPREIVGIVKDIKQDALSKESMPMMYTPYAQDPTRNITLVIRSSGEAAGLIAAVRNEIHAVDADQPIDNFLPLTQLVLASVGSQRFSALLFAIFAGVALLLATVGIYGVMSYTVTQSTHEIGIRMAIGGQPRDVFRNVMRRGMTLALIGVAVGLLGAFGLTRVMTTMLFEIRPTDPTTFASIAALLTGIASLACYIPARRATKVDPMVALRYE